jgi:enoyl-CoA hydratase
MNYETIRFEETGGIAVLTLNRPEALNALNAQLLEELSHAIEAIDRHSSIRALLLTGSGEKAFVAGADIKEIADLTPEKAMRFAERGQKIFRRLEILKVPVIAAVNGFALGGGCELAMSCDFIYASTNARFGLPEVSLGIMPGFGGTQRAARFVGWARAKEMIMTGRHYNAQEALAIGLVNAVCEPSELLKMATATATMIATRAPMAVARSKEAVNRGYDLSIDEGMEVERELFSELFRTQDQKEGTRAFVEKRKPQFKGE